MITIIDVIRRVTIKVYVVIRITIIVYDVKITIIAYDIIIITLIVHVVIRISIIVYDVIRTRNSKVDQLLLMFVFYKSSNSNIYLITSD